ncbi:helix-turn-helix domain-containing protein [Actinoallomurus sp. CA-142502]|uniref:helix-turn-helix domain-containing protein n=1 Tax=Actinoallomurus sp. CA-142502 TaxID=3239885 RepID=UPI003D8CC25C
MTVREVHHRLGVGQSTLRNWMAVPDKIPESKRSCPRCHGCPLDGSAYAYLLGLYLGDGHIAHGRKGVFRLDIACCDDWPGLTEAAVQALAAVLPTNSVGQRQRTGCTIVNMTSKHWPCIFPQHGPGMKHTRAIVLKGWQDEIVSEFGEEFVRGLIHSDGCRAVNRVRRPLKGGDRWYEYPRYFFTNASDDIRELFTDTLDRLGIEWKRSNKRIISITKKEAVARLDEFVGPKY